MISIISYRNFFSWLIIFLLSQNILKAQRQVDDLIALKDKEIVWDEGTLKLSDGRTFEGRFILDETYTEGAVLHLIENETTKVQTWPAFKVKSLHFHNREVVKIYSKLLPLKPSQWVLVEKIHESERYRLIKRRIPFNDIIVVPFAIGSAAWIVWASQISYRKVFFIIDNQNQVTEISGPSKDQGGDIRPGLLFKALKVDKNKLKKLLKQHDLNAFHSEDLPKILAQADILAKRSE